MKKDDRHSVDGIIGKNPFAGKEDHGILTVSVPIMMGGSQQGFGGLALEEKTLPRFIRDLCDTFGVGDFRMLPGKRCRVLYCWGLYNDTIEGLESVDTGKRFTITGWCNGVYPGKRKSPLVERRSRIMSEIEFLNRRIGEEKEKLRTLADDYVDWK